MQKVVEINEWNPHLRTNVGDEGSSSMKGSMQDPLR